MKKIKQWFRNWIQSDNVRIAREPEPTFGYASRSIDRSGIGLRVHRAVGGVVLESQVYDSNHDRHYTKLYIITDDQDLGAELGKIILMENLRA